MLLLISNDGTYYIIARSTEIVLLSCWHFCTHVTGNKVSKMTAAKIT